MTEGENKAIEYLKENSLVRLNENNEIVAYGNAHKYYIINLIEKLKKENQELRVQGSIILLDYNILKDKIKEKLNWYEDTCERLSKSGIELDMYERYQGAIELCKELLEEE